MKKIILLIVRGLVWLAVTIILAIVLLFILGTVLYLVGIDSANVPNWVGIAAFFGIAAISAISTDWVLKKLWRV